MDFFILNQFWIDFWLQKHGKIDFKSILIFFGSKSMEKFILD